MRDDGRDLQDSITYVGWYPPSEDEINWKLKNDRYECINRSWVPELLLASSRLAR